MSDPPTIPLGGLPDGVVARPFNRHDGTVAVDRKRRIKTDKVVLTADPQSIPVPAGESVPGMVDAEVGWAVATARRQWTSIEHKFTGRAPAALAALVRAGVVTALATVSEDLTVSTFRYWAATAPWRAWHDASSAADRERSEAWNVRAQRAAAAVATLDPGLAAALDRARGNDPLLPVLVYAAEDLADDLSHDGPRAFSQTHFESTKVRDDIAHILLKAGADPVTLFALGLRRSPYIGLGGPLYIPETRGAAALDLDCFSGPVQFRADDPAVCPDFRRPSPLLLVENLQAAEAVCDGHPDTAVVWFAGQPSDITLRRIVELARGAERVLLAADADLGGVRIAARIVTALAQSGTEVCVIDVGEHPHRSREPFRQGTIDALTGYTFGPVASFARAVLARGYPVEQEATIRAALKSALAR